MDIAVITGASSGLGVEYAKAVIDMYPALDEIWLVARRKDRLLAFAEKYRSVNIRAVALDLAQNSSYEELHNLLKDEHANVRILVNNAGFERTGRLDSMDKSDILAMIDLNVKGFTMVNRVCLPFMKKGSIGVMTCSVSSFCPVPAQAVYSASKIYVRFLSRAIREEMKKKGVNILAMCPGNMDTEMNPKGGTSQSPSVDRLPFLDMRVITRKSLKFAESGRAIYTPGGLYKVYRAAAKLLPTSCVIKVTGKGYDF